MAITLSFPGRFPMVSKYDSNSADISALYSFESSNGNATVGNNYSQTGSGGTLNFPYAVNGKGAYTQPVGPNPFQDGGTAYTRSTSDSPMEYAVGRSWGNWFKQQIYPGNGNSFGWMRKKSGTAGDTGFINFSPYNYFRFDLKNQDRSGTLTFYTNSDLVDFTDEQWHYVVFSANATNDHRLYVDGILHDSSSTTWDGATGNTEWGLNCGPNTGGVYNGTLDEISVINRATTGANAYAYGGALLV